MCRDDEHEPGSENGQDIQPALLVWRSIRIQARSELAIGQGAPGRSAAVRRFSGSGDRGRGV